MRLKWDKSTTNNVFNTNHNNVLLLLLLFPNKNKYFFLSFLIIFFFISIKIYIYIEIKKNLINATHKVAPGKIYCSNIYLQIFIFICGPTCKTFTHKYALWRKLCRLIFVMRKLMWCNLCSVIFNHATGLLHVRISKFCASAAHHHVWCTQSVCILILAPLRPPNHPTPIYSTIKWIGNICSPGPSKATQLSLERHTSNYANLVNISIINFCFIIRAQQTVWLVMFCWCTFVFICI